MKETKEYIQIQISPTVRLIDHGDDVEIDLSNLPEDVKSKNEEEIKAYVLENINDFPEYAEGISKIEERILNRNELDINIVVDIEDYSLEILN